MSKKVEAITLPSGREVKLAQPGPLKLTRLGKKFQDDGGNSVDATVEMLLAFIVEPVFADEADLDNFLAEDYEDLAALSGAIEKMSAEVKDRLAPLSGSAATA